MSKEIPGIHEETGREVFYIEAQPGEGFNEIIDAALAGSLNIPLPKDGGVIEEKVRIILKDRTSLIGVSYRGDLTGWRDKLLAYCKATHRKGGIASKQKLTLTDGTEQALLECEVVFDR